MGNHPTKGTVYPADRIGLEKPVRVLAEYYTEEQIKNAVAEIFRDLKLLRDLGSKPCSEVQLKLL